ncbi:glycoside hydrolase family 97 protein [Paradesertivirga mongoliensis]|uniref:Glycoside hydrolase family 97 protein n=1 Tax=Paradesertivirga mongoliensis TaxID=2100740 RepID=A0ABW4ZJJ3_9SPHI|nr:glycoside hydrolase family 97 protein [Pedobacter mongoliensis]
MQLLKNIIRGGVNAGFFLGLGMGACVLCLPGKVTGQQKYALTSPNKNIRVEVSLGDSIRYQVFYSRQLVVGPSVINLELDNSSSDRFRVVKSSRNKVQQTLRPVVWQKSKSITDNYQELHLDLNKDLALEWRAYDSGVAWRWLSSKRGNYKVLGEKASFQFHQGDTAWYPLENSFFSHNERVYRKLPVDSLDGKLGSLPTLFDSKGLNILVTESNLFNYAGMWLKGAQNNKVEAIFPNYPKTTKETSDRDRPVTERENFVARIEGPQGFPWRILIMEKEDKNLLTNQLPYQLGTPATGDYSWVKAGKSAWDWWNAWNLAGVDFKAGPNTQTYKYYIDFASKYDIPYFVVDEGWGDTKELLKIAPNVNMDELSAYARQKNVGLVLWANWLAIEKDMDTKLDQLEAWGVKGIKVDFMQRDDQEMVLFYEKVAREAAKRKMLVDFHGAYKPTGWSRTFPNVITSEGVYGAENTKWDKTQEIDSDHNVTLPFIRMVAGPMDYTPGAMLNAQKKSWAPINDKPMSIGTRCHELAKFVVFESPLQMLADNPVHYEKEKEAMGFLKAVPVEWEVTLPLEAKKGEYVVMARKGRNGEWYIGAMTDEAARNFNLNLSFLEPGQYTLQYWKDGINAALDAQDFKTGTIEVTSQSTIKAELETAGGWVARIIKK